MKYMMLIYTHDNGSWSELSEDEQNAISQEYYAISSEPGVRGGDQLQPDAGKGEDVLDQEGAADHQAESHAEP